MHSFGNRLAVIGLTLGALALMAGGCSKVKKATRPAEPFYEPSRIPESDPAIATRDWPQSVAHVANGDVEVRYQRWIYDYDRYRETKAWTPVTEPVLFVYNTVRIPVSYIWAWPGRTQVESGVQFEPTYTGMTSFRDTTGGGVTLGASNTAAVDGVDPTVPANGVDAGPGADASRTGN